jgi:hypothetical protein
VLGIGGVRTAAAIRVQGSLAFTATYYVSQCRSQLSIDIAVRMNQREVKTRTGFRYTSCRTTFAINFLALREYLHSIITISGLVLQRRSGKLLVIERKACSFSTLHT